MVVDGYYDGVYAFVFFLISFLTDVDDLQERWLSLCETKMPAGTLGWC